MTEARRVNKKRAIIEELADTPVVELACRKLGLPRSTYYRWLANDSSFAEKAELAVAQGIDRVNDLAEHRIVMKINEGNQKAIEFWLTHNHRRYIKRRPSIRPYKPRILRLWRDDDEW